MLPILFIFVLSACEEGGFRGIGANPTASPSTGGAGSGGGAGGTGGGGGSGGGDTGGGSGEDDPGEETTPTCSVEFTSAYTSKIMGTFTYATGGGTPLNANFNFRYSDDGSTVTGSYKDCTFATSEVTASKATSSLVLEIKFTVAVNGAKRLVFTIEDEDGGAIEGTFASYTAATGGTLVHSGTFSGVMTGPPSGGGTEPAITGTWKACVTDGVESAKVTIKPGDPMVYEELVHEGTTCSGKQLYKATYKYDVLFLTGNVTVAGKSAYKIDMTTKEVMLTPLHKDVRDDLNDQAFCGLTGWKTSQGKFVNGCRNSDLRFPVFGETIYSILYVNPAGTNMEIGAATASNPGTVSTNRHNTFLSPVLVKQ